MTEYSSGTWPSCHTSSQYQWSPSTDTQIASMKTLSWKNSVSGPKRASVRVCLPPRPPMYFCPPSQHLQQAKEGGYLPTNCLPLHQARCGPCPQCLPMGHNSPERSGSPKGTQFFSGLSAPAGKMPSQSCPAGALMGSAHACA